jgi:hypothetical protein
LHFVPFKKASNTEQSFILERKKKRGKDTFTTVFTHAERGQPKMVVAWKHRVNCWSLEVDLHPVYQG